MQRMLSLFRMEFEDPNQMRSDIAGRPIYMALSMTPEKKGAPEAAEPVGQPAAGPGVIETGLSRVRRPGFPGQMAAGRYYGKSWPKGTQK